MQLTTSQQWALEKLKQEYIKKMNSTNNKVYFKAPTGAGKTLIASYFLNWIIENHNNGIITIFATVSNSELPFQLAKKLNSYQQYHSFNNYQIEHIQSPSNLKEKRDDYHGFNCNYQIRENKVFVVGASSFTKNSIFTVNHEIENLIEDIKLHNYKLVYFRDEAHIGVKRRGEREALTRLDDFRLAADFVFEMTATPPVDSSYLQITEKKLQEDAPRFLLKTNKQSEDLKHENMIDSEVLDLAIKNFKMCREEYKKLKTPTGKTINPAMLIQISNKPDKSKKPIEYQQYIDTLAMIYQKLNNARLVYLTYFDNEKKVSNSTCPNTLEYASENNSIIDVIVFKVGPATGWDIPRANMLVQLRNVSSEALNIQTIGRIKRNPYPNLESNTITNKYFLYSNYTEKNKREVLYQIKPEFKDEVFLRGTIDKPSKKTEIELIYKIRMLKDIIKFLNGDDFMEQIKEFNGDNDFINEEEGKLVISAPPRIKNYFWLKIYLWKMNNVYQQSKYLRNPSIRHAIENLAYTNNKSAELIEYLYFRNITKIKNMQNILWEKIKSDPSKYKIKGNVWLPNDYYIERKGWFVDLTSFSQQYGYEIRNIASTKEKNIQFLDSKPEKIFLKKLISLSWFKNNKHNIKFYAKMPVLNSIIYFEYFAPDNIIRRSYIDFAIKFQDYIIMIEVKSKDNDYDQEKTAKLKDAYHMYMKSNSKQKIILAVCEVNTLREPAVLEISYTNKNLERVKVYSLLKFFEKNFA